jgi:hypothetical protein
MTELELITTALAAGAGVGVKDTAASAVKDAYAGLKDLLAGRLAGRPAAAEVLESEEPQARVWQALLEDDLGAAGALTDTEILKAARHLLALLDPARVSTVTVGSNYGAAGTFYAPITITNTAPPAPGP